MSKRNLVEKMKSILRAEKELKKEYELNNGVGCWWIKRELECLNNNKQEIVKLAKEMC